MYKIGLSIISIKSISKVNTSLNPSFYFQRFSFSISGLRSDDPTVIHNESGYSNFHNYFGKCSEFNHFNDFQHLNGNPNGFHENRSEIYPNMDLNRSNMGSVEGSRIGGQFEHVNNFPNFQRDSNRFMKKAHNQATNLGREGPTFGNRNMRNGTNGEISPNKDCNRSNKKKHSYYFECLSRLQESYNQAGDTPENKSRISDFNPFHDVNKDFNFQDFNTGQTAGFSQNKGNRFSNLQSWGGAANGGYKENFDFSNKSVNGRNNFENSQQNFNKNNNNKGSVDGSRIGKQFHPFEKSNLYSSKDKIGPATVNYPNELQRKSANNIANSFLGQGGDANGVYGERVGLHNVFANSVRNSENMQRNGNKFHGNNHHNVGSVEGPRIGRPFNHISPDMYPSLDLNEYHGNDHYNMQNGEGLRIGGPMHSNPNLYEHHGNGHQNLHDGEGFRFGGQLNHFNRPDMYSNSNHIGSIRGQYPNAFQRSSMINGVDNFQGWGGNADGVYRERFNLPHGYVNDWRGYGNTPQTFNPYHQNMGSVEGSRIGGQSNHFDSFQYLGGGGSVKELHNNAYDSRNMIDMHNYANQYQGYNKVPFFRGEGPFNGCQNLRVGNRVYVDRFSPNSYQGNIPNFRGEGPFNGYQNLRDVRNGVYEGRFSPNSRQGNTQAPKFMGESSVNGYQNLRGVSNGVYEGRFPPNSYQGNTQAPKFIGESPVNGYQNLSSIGNGVYGGRFSPNSEYDGLNQHKLYDVNARDLYRLQQNAPEENNQLPKFRGGPLNGYQNSRGVGNGGYEGRTSPNSAYNWSNQQNPYDFNARGLYSMQQNAYQRYSQASNFGVAETFQREESRFTHGFSQMNGFQRASYNQRTGSQYTYRDQYGNMPTHLQQNSNGYIQQFNAD